MLRSCLCIRMYVRMNEWIYVCGCCCGVSWRILLIHYDAWARVDVCIIFAYPYGCSICVWLCVSICVCKNNRNYLLPHVLCHPSGNHPKVRIQQGQRWLQDVRSHTTLHTFVPMYLVFICIFSRISNNSGKELSWWKTDLPFEYLRILLKMLNIEWMRTS